MITGQNRMAMMERPFVNTLATPAMCSMQNLSVIPAPERKDIGILSVGNSKEINEAFQDCSNLLIKPKPDYRADFKSFVISM